MAKARIALSASCLNHGSRVLGKGKYICAFIHERFGCLLSASRVKPIREPAHVYFGFWINFRRAQRKSVDMPLHFGNGKSGGVAYLIGLGERTRDKPVDVISLVHFRDVGHNVGCSLKACGMTEHNVWITLGGGECGVGVAKRGREDNVGTLIDKLIDKRLGVAFGYALDKSRLDAQFFLQLLTTQVMRVRPARVPHRTDIDKANLDILGCHLCACSTYQKCHKQ